MLEAATHEEILAYQLRTLTELIRYAASFVPYYSDTWSSNLTALEPRSLDDIRRLPLLEKTLVRKQSAQFHSASDPGRLTVGTSGSTGMPLRVRCSAQALRRNYAHFFRLRDLLGVGNGARCATFAGRTLVRAERDTPPFWRRNWSSNTLLFSTYHLSPDTVGQYLERLARQRPQLIDSYPSALGLVADAALRYPEFRVRPKAIITSSETLLAAQRQKAEEAFQCKVTDQYGAAEMTTFIAQCEAGTYHAWPSYGIVEVLVDGRPAKAGERGELVTTGFVNWSMPLVRYRTGDFVVLGDGCSCDSPYPTLASIEGRADDVVVTPSGRHVGRLDPAFKGLPEDSLVEAQIVQRQIDLIEVRYVPGPRFLPDHLVSLGRELERRLGPEMRIRMVEIARIPRGPGGKRRAVIGLGANP